MKCYLCERENLTVLATQLRSGPGTVLYCDECEIGFLQHKTSDLQAFYDEEYRKKYGPNVHTSSNYAEIFDSYVNYQQQRLDLLKPYLGSEKKLLEVGCSTGHFLYNVKDLVGEAIGVDYDSGATTFAAEKCGCATFGCGLDDAGPPLASFDIVCAFQTMEHVNEPVQFAAMLRKYLKPDGVVFIEVPNLRDPLLSIYNNTAYRDFWFRDVHVFYFTSRSLKTVMQRAGFSGDVYFSQDYNFLNHLSWILRNAPQETCHEGLSSPRLPISEQVSPELRKDLNAWLQSIDKDYKALLATHGITSNISFIGELA